ncbi:hypothetical protein B0H16DRAFT_1463162 [Mycena metata]|uniref:Cell division control protein n=1 Tax=Mycena metata TaxID=1033252 RepID=A0AAD7IJP0_9AGAR|nr:hypothetical protein B0H16DRAFT_1463162 [Mycena metata]
MSARRQPSTTSLSKYVRGADIGPHDRSTDFCNAFWGLGDGGVEVLFARMRGASRTMDELRNFWKERAAIEDDYAKRLAKLSKQVLGRDEIGELRNSLDTIRLETERQASYHLTLSQQVRADLEAQASAFYAKQQHHKKQYQTAIEKEFKAKAAARDLGLVQGKDAEKIHLKLERAQQTVVSNERDFGNFARALADTVAKWEQDWKIFCDSCQDLGGGPYGIYEGQYVGLRQRRVDCSCEKMRLALEQMEPDKDMENFVRDYGTGNQIPDPPAFVDFTDPNAIPSSSSRPTFRTSNFPRSSQRPPPVRRNSAQPEEEEPQGNIAGVGLPGSVRRGDDPAAAASAASASTQNHRASTAPIQEPQQPPPQQLQHQQPNGFSADWKRRCRPHIRVPPRDPMAEPIDPTADTFIKVGPNAYKVDLTKDPYAIRPVIHSRCPRVFAAERHRSSGEADGGPAVEGNRPAAKYTGYIATRDDGRAAAIRMLSTIIPTRAHPPPLSLAAPGPSSSAIPQNQQRAQSPGRDYRHSAEAVVGSHPSASRPASPNPITAAFMRPGSAAGPPSSEIIADVLTDYHQSLPGERKSVSRSNSRRGSYASATGPSPSPAKGSQQGYGQGLTRPPSQGGFAGVGTPGGSRSASPQPMSRGPSPAPVIANVRHSFIAPPAQQSGSMGRSGAASPNNMGIALDSSGRVIHDEMAQRYQQQQQQQHRQSMQPVQTQATQPPYNPHAQQPQRRLSYMGPWGRLPRHHHNSSIMRWHRISLSRPCITCRRRRRCSPRTQPAPAPYQAPPPQQQQVYQPQPHTNSYTAVNALQRGVSTGSGYFPTQQQQVSPHQQQLQQQMQLQPVQQAPVRRSPSPNQSQQQTADGKWILFYVKALFNYAATIDEEFDFQEGDIIAVTATPEDGWWSGELLDENRRTRNSHTLHVVSRLGAFFLESPGAIDSAHPRYELNASTSALTQLRSRSYPPMERDIWIQQGPEQDYNVAASRPSPSPVNLNRALVVQGLPGDTTLHSILLNVNQGALEFARIEDEPSEFAFLPPSQGPDAQLPREQLRAGLRRHAPRRARAPARVHPLPLSQLALAPADPAPGLYLRGRSQQHRAAACSLSPGGIPARTSCSPMTLGQFGPLERFWRFNPRLLVVSFFAIADAIKAKAHIPRNPAPGTWLSVGYFADWCELSEEARSHLMRKSRRETYRAYHPLKTSTSNAPNARKGKRTTPSKSTPNGEPETTPTTTVSPTNPVMERYKAALDSMDVTAFQASPAVLMMKEGSPSPYKEDPSDRNGPNWSGLALYASNKDGDEEGTPEISAAARRRIRNRC